jgi:hypothetical protein
MPRKAPRAKLDDEHRTFLVQQFAIYRTPSEVLADFQAEYPNAPAVTRQAVEAYNPDCRNGRKLAKKWKDIHAKTRKAFLEDTASIGIANRNVRLRVLDEMVAEARARKNHRLVAELLEQAAKEMGDAFTNMRRIAGKAGEAPVAFTGIAEVLASIDGSQTGTEPPTPP